MNINPSAASIIAGTARAAARGGEADNQAIDANNKKATAEKPAGKAVDSDAVDAGDQTDDRGGNGQQVLDVFQSGEEEKEGEQEKPSSKKSISPEGAGGNLDFEG
jgi:hypothetical protein